MSARSLPERTMNQFRFPALPVAAAVAALTATTAIFGALLGLFDAPTQQRWLVASPEVLQMAADCEARPDRQARGECMSQLAAALHAREQRGTQVAHQ
jgi:hypothetical protein